MLPENRIPTHPGEVLLEEFLNPLGVSQVAFAGHLGVPVQRVNEIVLGKRGVTPEFWLNLQTNYDLARFRPKKRVGRIAVAA